MTFSESLKVENQDIFQAILDHPFVQGIGKESVPKEALTHYIKADYEYLNAFMQIYGIAISKSSKREDIQFFNKQIEFVLNSEIHPHHNFCDQIGVSYEELQGYPLPPTADHYIKHMMFHAQTVSLAEIICALLPCPWTYVVIGKELMKTYNPSPNHAFYPWISFYADTRIENTTLTMRKRLDELAETASIQEQKRMKDAFRKSCQLELAFWEMAYNCEAWHGDDAVMNR